MPKTHQTPPTSRRWLKSVIAASAQPLPAFPWMRGQRSAVRTSHGLAAGGSADAATPCRPSGIAAR